MKPFSKLVAAMVLGFGFTGAAQAAWVSLSPAYSFDTDSSYRLGRINHGHEGGFKDDFFFSLTGDAVISVEMEHTYLAEWSLSVTDTRTGNILASFDKPTGAFDVVTLGAGSYSFSVEGIANATPSGPQGWYGFTLSSSPAAAVPEPETYAMLLAGLGIVGAVARRRRQA